jgi:hypothetical protein
MSPSLIPATIGKDTQTQVMNFYSIYVHHDSSALSDLLPINNTMVVGILMSRLQAVSSFDSAVYAYNGVKRL